MTDDCWATIAKQVEELTRAGSTDDVLRILSPERNPNGNPSVIAGEGFFAGSGGHAGVMDALLAAGWQVIWCETDYYFAMRAPDGSAITYVEGDIYSGEGSAQRPTKVASGEHTDLVTQFSALGAELRIWEPNVHENDLGRMYVLEALGVTIQIREREDGTYVHVEDEEVVRAPLLVEINNGGDNAYGDSLSAPGC